MKNKRPNGDGSFRKRSANSWEGSAVVDGRRQYVYGKSRQEIKEKLSCLISDPPPPTTAVTVGEWMDVWIASYTAKVKSSTRSRYAQDIRCHIKPELGDVCLQDLGLITVQRFLNRCKQEKGLSEKSLKNIYLVLNKAMTRAQKDGLIRTNPCADAEIPAYEEPQKEMRPLKDKEVPLFLASIRGHPFEPLYYVALFTGMRESELIGLTWDCVDFDAGTVHLYRQYKAVRDKSRTYAFTTLKNKQDRTFTPPPSVMNVLRNCLAQQEQWKSRYGPSYRNPENFVFTNELGSHIPTFMVWRQFKKIVTAMGLPQIRFHDLRHTYATLALQNGVDIKTVSNNLGHSTVAFTMDKYAHVSMTMQLDSAAKMEAFISGCGIVVA